MQKTAAADLLSLSQARKKPNQKLVFRLRKGLDLPLPGKPRDLPEESKPCRTVGLLGDDYPGLKPEILVKIGAEVRIGQPLMRDKNNPEALFTAPAGGRVRAVNRGAKRRLLSVEISVEGDEALSFPAYGEKELSELPAHKIRSALVESGLWITLRSRPFSRIPRPGEWPASLFVTAMDSQPLAAPAEKFIQDNGKSFRTGLLALARLVDKPVYLCRRPGPEMPGEDLPGVNTALFLGPHPAGLPGTHIHFIDPVKRGKFVWYINYQDVSAIGSFFLQGRLPVERCISLAGPGALRPRLLKTRVGADLNDISAGELQGDNLRVISGSVLAGRCCTPGENFLGRYHQQVSIIPEGGARQFLGWARPGRTAYSLTRSFLGAFLTPKAYDFSASLHGSPRAMIPIGIYEKMMPLELMPTFLLKALITEDLDQAEALGALELDQEDLALCTFACPGKYDYGPMLRRTLDFLEKEG
jgi:Na+-transporting NADH:ubiquinone oxidoreductase subunit A